MEESGTAYQRDHSLLKSHIKIRIYSLKVQSNITYQKMFICLQNVVCTSKNGKRLFLTTTYYSIVLCAETPKDLTYLHSRGSGVIEAATVNFLSE